MDLVILIYLIGILTETNLFIGASVVGIFLAVIIVVIYAINADHYDSDEESSIYYKGKRVWATFPRKLVKGVAVSSLCLLCLDAAIPSKDTAYAMVAAYGITELAQNERVQELGDKSLEVLESAMSDYLDEGDTDDTEH